MIIVLMVVSLILAILLWNIDKKILGYNSAEITWYGITAIASGIVFVVTLIATVVLSVDISGSYALDKKIDMYEAENKNIETDINNLVKEYMAHESETFSELKDKDGISLVSLYPDLKSDKLVNKQIDLYTKNNKNIKRLKRERIDLSTEKWWLYFGR